MEVAVVGVEPYLSLGSGCILMLGGVALPWKDQVLLDLLLLGLLEKQVASVARSAF